MLLMYARQTTFRKKNGRSARVGHVIDFESKIVSDRLSNPGAPTKLSKP
jgi:hypothetical protein